MQAMAGPESAFDALYSQHILRIYAAWNGLGGGGGAPKLSLPPGSGNPKHAIAHLLIFNLSSGSGSRQNPLRLIPGKNNDHTSRRFGE